MTTETCHADTHGRRGRATADRGPESRNAIVHPHGDELTHHQPFFSGLLEAGER
jgi:hypothetical protein